MTARRLRPEKLVLTSEVMRVLRKEGLIAAEVVIGKDGKGFIRFEPEGEFERLEEAHPQGCRCRICRLNDEVDDE